eukprot:augustus_masked-scaffold_2-processed-gene-23.9-mRNA-1 protein AED:1.00 eAED:1.00 QI:0/-1/0/0/-1/1/1/0/267
MGKCLGKNTKQHQRKNDTNSEKKEIDKLKQENNVQSINNPNQEVPKSAIPVLDSNSNVRNNGEVAKEKQETINSEPKIPEGKEVIEEESVKSIDSHFSEVPSAEEDNLAEKFSESEDSEVVIKPAQTPFPEHKEGISVLSPEKKTSVEAAAAESVNESKSKRVEKEASPPKETTKKESGFIMERKVDGSGYEKKKIEESSVLQLRNKFENRLNRQNTSREERALQEKQDRIKEIQNQAKQRRTPKQLKKDVETNEEINKIVEARKEF